MAGGSAPGIGYGASDSAFKATRLAAKLTPARGPLSAPRSRLGRLRRVYLIMRAFLWIVSGRVQRWRLFADQAELQRLGEVIAAGPVLDHLSVPQSPDMYLLCGELLACGRLPEEFAHVVTVHDQARDDLVAFADLVL